MDCNAVLVAAAQRRSTTKMEEEEFCLERTCLISRRSSSHAIFRNTHMSICYIVLFAYLSTTYGLATAEEEIFKPPRIITPERQRTIYTPEGNNVTLPCKADGTPRPTYKWRKDGADVDPSEYIRFNTATGDLIILGFTSREEGVYTCLATNMMKNTVPVSMSSPQRLLATRVDQFKDSTVPQIKTVNQYSYFKLPCADQGVVVGAVGDITYNWYDVKDTKQLTLDNERMYVAIDGTLHFTYAKLSDEFQTSHAYQCGITSRVLNLIRLGNSMTVDVVETGPTASRPVLQYYTSGKKFVLGTQAELECVFSGYETTGDRLPRIKWYDNAGNTVKFDTPKYSVDHNNRVLKVTDLTESDRRKFSCEASTSAGSSSIQGLFLNVTSPPIWEKVPEDTTVPEGRDVTMWCKARSLSGELAPSIPVWKINGADFDGSGKSRISLSADRKSLTVRDVTKANDIFCVHCMVKNSEGQTMGDACINVILPIILKVTCEKCRGQDPNSCSCTQWELSKGDSIKVRFSESTDPAFMLSHDWLVDGTTYKEPSRPSYMTFDPVNKEYTLDTSGLTEKEFTEIGGDYVYKVYHPFDSRNISISVSLKGITPAPAVSSAGMDMWIIGLIIGIILLVIVVVIIVVFIVWRKLQEGDYNVDKKETNAGLDPVQEMKNKAFTDFSTPEYDFYEEDKKQPVTNMEYDEGPFAADDEESLGEYGVEEIRHFNENGSFIGDYAPTTIRPVANGNGQYQNQSQNVDHNTSTETAI